MGGRKNKLNNNYLQGFVLLASIILFVFLVALFGSGNLEAETNITPTLIVTDRSYLPYISGILKGPTATPTIPQPTLTPQATNTITSTATPTATSDPAATATSTPSPTATNEFQLPKPTLYDIENGDGDGNFTVAWSAVPGANRYRLMENFDDNTWETLYDGPALIFDRSGLEPGEYCYNVRAFGSSGRSDWAGEKCTTVVGEPEPEYMCELETIYEGPRFGWDIELLHDGRVFITHTSEDSASIFDPKTRSFQQVILPQGGGRYAAVLNDGTVLLTIEGDDPHSMIYNPVTGEVTRLDNIYDCLEVYAFGPYGNKDLVTYCSRDNRGYVYGYFNTEHEWVGEYLTDYARFGPNHYLIFHHVFRSSNSYVLTDGLTTYSVDYYSDGSWLGTEKRFDNGLNKNDPASVLSPDKHTIYISGGSDCCHAISEAHLSAFNEYYSDNSFMQFTDMLQARAYHDITALFDGNVIVSGGTSQIASNGAPLDFLNDIELYAPSKGKWYTAGTLNVAREGHQAIQLLNGEIFVFGGRTEPGPGYGFNAPTEIGRCERIE